MDGAAGMCRELSHDAGAMTRIVDKLETWIDAVEQSLGVATLIIPNAAIVHVGGVREAKPELWDKELQVNLSGAFCLLDF